MLNSFHAQVAKNLVLLFGSSIALALPVGAAPHNPGADAQEPQTPAGIEQPITPANFWNRPTLSGDWGGSRSQLAEDGAHVRLFATGYTQGQWAGKGLNQETLSGGRLDALIDFDTAAMGLWRGGGFHVHAEYKAGPVPAFRGGSVVPVNTAALLPLDAENQVIFSSLFYTQTWGGTALLVGRLNPIDLLQADPFFGGWGIDRFMNLGIGAPPDGVVPATIVGGMISQKIGEVGLTGLVFDPHDRTNDYWPEDLFSEGVSTLLSADWNGKAFGRKSNLALSWVYTSKAGADLAQVLNPDFHQSNPTRPSSNNLSFQFGHTILPSKAVPGQGIGIYGKFAIGDGNPNIIQHSFVGGITGQGMFSNRPNDGFGIGYYWYDWSNALEDSLDPLLQLRSDQGLELYYNLALTPWLTITPDLQFVVPSRSNVPTAIVAALRAKITF